MSAGSPSTSLATAARPAGAGTLIWIGLLAGVFDITDNIIFNLFRSITPYQIFQYIASGLIGPRAFHLGWSSVALGVVLHFTIALIWTTVFFLASRKLAFLVRRPVLWGPVYGIIVYIFMEWVVLPRSGIPQPRVISLANRVNGVLALMFCIGFAVAMFISRRFPVPQD